MAAEGREKHSMLDAILEKMKIENKVHLLVPNLFDA